MSLNGCIYKSDNILKSILFIEERSHKQKCEEASVKSILRLDGT